MSYRQQVASQFNVPVSAVSQVGSKSMAEVTCAGYILLVSYHTIIGVRPAGEFKWYITTKKHSSTTSRQTTQFISSTRFSVERVTEDELQDKLAKLRGQHE